MTRLVGLLFAALSAAATSACMDSLPKFEAAVGAPQSAPLPVAAPPLPFPVVSSGKPGAAGPVDSPRNGSSAAKAIGPVADETIVALKSTMIVLYRDQSGFDGERIAASSFSLPAAARPAAGNPKRLEVLTAAGPRWVERAEVTVDLPSNSPPRP